MADATQIEAIARPERHPWRLRGGRHLLLLGVVLFLVAYPLGMLLYGSLRDAPPGWPGSFTLRSFSTVFADPEVWRSLQVTLLLAIPRVALAMSLAIAFAWLIARTDLPHKGFVEGLLLFMFFLPGLPWIIAWRYLASPRSGFLNNFLFSHLPVPGLQVDVFSYGGIIVLGALQIVSLLYLFLLPAFKAMDASLEESSRVSGAGGWTTFWRIHLPLLAPALLGTAILGLIFTLGSFELESLLGRPAGIYVVTNRIYDYIYRSVYPQWGPAMALSMVFVAFTAVLVVIQWRLLGRKHYTVVSGRGYQARLHSLGRWRYVIFALILAFFGFFALLPFAVLLLNTFAFLPSFYWEGYFTLNNWKYAFMSHQLGRSLRNTIVLGVGAATLGIAFCALVAYTVTRTRWRGRQALDLLAWLPWTVPGMVMGLGYLWAYIFMPDPFNIYGTLWVLGLASIARGLPLGTRVLTGTMVQIGAELEESSRVSGASWLQTFRHIWLPLLGPAFLSGWLILFVFAVRSVDTIIMIYGPSARVLAIDVWGGGGGGSGAVLALLLTFLMVLAFVGATLLARRYRLT